MKCTRYIGIWKNARNTDGSLGTDTKLLLPSWLLGFRHEETETQFLLCSLFVQRQLSTHWQNQRACTPQQTTGLVYVQISTNCFFFFKIPKNSSPTLPSMTSLTSPVLFPIQGFYYDVFHCHILLARVWTHVLNVYPYPCTKPNSSKPN